MRTTRLTRRVPVWTAIAAAALLGTGAPAGACSIPVFRYALERWRPDPYEVLVFHRGELTAEQSALLAKLQPVYVPGEPTPNLAITQVDLAADPVRPEFAAIWSADGGGGERLPWIVVRTPWKGENFTVWTGPLAAESIAAIHTSPQRAELIRRLAGGDSIVWVFVDGDDPAESDRLAQSSTEQLQQLVAGIQLPEIRPEDLSSLSVDPESLGLKFSFLRLKPQDETEQLTIKSLLAVKPGLTDAVAAGEPLLFPVFGRGRMFFPLVGTDISPLNLEDLARFLCGACQCTIKEQNPGLDLLTTVDWDAYVLGIPTEKPLPPLAGLGGFTTSADVPAAPVDAADAPHAGTSAAQSPANLEAPAPDSAGVPTATAPPAAPGGQPPVLPQRLDANPGVLSFWMVGLLTGAVTIASLWLRPRG